MEVVGERENGRARGRQARGEGALSLSPRAPPFCARRVQYICTETTPINLLFAFAYTN